MSRLACLALVLAACGGPSKPPPLAPDAPMPAGATWEGTWSTTFGDITFVAEVPEVPFMAEYAFARDAAPVTGHLYCNDADNHGEHHNLMVCITDVDHEHVMLTMQPDGRSFVSNWWLDRERWLRWEGQR